MFKITFLICLAAQAVQARADSQSLFGAAGNDRCGVGSMIFKNNSSISSQTLEVSTDSYSSETVSVTTGTSGCSNSGIAGVPQGELIYASANYEELMFEMASGQGEALEGLAETMGCDQSDFPLFMQTSKSSYSEVYPSASVQPGQMVMSFRKQLQSVPQLVSGCRSLHS